MAGSLRVRLSRCESFTQFIVQLFIFSLFHFQKFIHIGTKKPHIVCSGVLISDRYILTAAQCINGHNSSWLDYDVVLGEHNIEDSTDCYRDNKNSTVCASLPFHVTIAKAIIHENYTESPRSNDIALLRLRSSLPLTQYVKPICLPTESDKFGFDELTMAGWSSKIESEINGTTFYSQLIEPLQAFPWAVELGVCRRIYPELGIEFASKQICANSSKINSDLVEESCIGDIGGPLMGLDLESKLRDTDNSQEVYAVVGITSFRNCSSGWRKPVAYTRVSEYVEWIKSKLEF